MVSTAVMNVLRSSAIVCKEKLCFDDSWMLFTFLDFVEIIIFCLVTLFNSELN